MEDICYFLTGQLETNARNILPTYPCSQPSDSLAFRTSLFKYLEALRHRALFGSSQKSSATTQKTKSGNEAVLRGTAWWWKDVVVRKSLLEECTGDRFECLIVAFSTRVLLHKSRAYTQEQVFGLAVTVSTAYSGQLLRCQSSRRDWVQKAVFLSQRRQNLDALKNILLVDGKGSKLRGLSTENILTLVQVKYQDIRHRFWTGKQGSAALAYLLRLVGVIIPGVNSSPPQSCQDGLPLTSKHIEQPAKLPILPVAAAHHPAELKRLRRSVVPQTSISELDSGAGPSRVAGALFSDVVLSMQAMHKHLSDALSDIQRKNSKLPKPPSSKIADRFITPFSMPKVNGGGELLQKPIVDHSLLKRLSLFDPGSQKGFEHKIDYIRQNLLPPFPSPPDPHAPRTTPTEPAAPGSHIPRLKRGPDFDQKPPHKPTSVQTPRNPRTAREPKKSIRASLAHNMIKHASEERKKTFEDEATKIIFATEDDSTENLDLMTPRSKAPPNRLWTSGQKGTPRAIKRSRKSIMLTFEEPLAVLPLVPATSTGSMSLLDDEDDDGDLLRGNGMMQRLPGSGTEVELGGYSTDGERPQASMTLRELLLAADTSNFDLIDDEEEDYLEGLSGWEEPDLDRDN
ncbi:hypothetical protein P691DRAFT_703357 [Macrolepiota fuliginosa MF-IS2]|uniref:HAUS augmin-like complex subunit 6 N-terminal domain-containing protein n=1 Tax=Macrolepiota fuliginosa MF-IS2 TaxID=1400762 RepID=A0A9P5XEM1_9AGAR|nr:hypothetical protein P691DRAFT_703357 [Macrolepiota fuliginosa MF-IS2]